MQFDFDNRQRKEILEIVSEKLENYYSSTKDFKTNPDLNIKEIRESILTKDLANGISPDKAIEHVIKDLRPFQFIHHILSILDCSIHVLIMQELSLT